MWEGAPQGGGWPLRGLNGGDLLCVAQAGGAARSPLHPHLLPGLPARPPAGSYASQPGFFSTAGPVCRGRGGRGSRVESFVTQKFQGGLGGGGEEGEGGRGRCVRSCAGLGGDASHPARPLLSLSLQETALPSQPGTPALYLSSGEDPAPCE